MFFFKFFVRIEINNNLIDKFVKTTYTCYYNAFSALNLLAQAAPVYSVFGFIGLLQVVDNVQKDCPLVLQVVKVVDNEWAPNRQLVYVVTEVVQNHLDSPLVLQVEVLTKVLPMESSLLVLVVV